MGIDPLNIATTGLWLTNRSKDTTRLHTTPATCTGLEWVHARVRDHGETLEQHMRPVEVTVATLLRPGRLFCRVCALEPATLDVFTLTGGDDRDVTCTIGAIPPQQPGSPPRAPTESATARLARIAARVGLDFTEEPTCGGVAYGIVPTRALPLLEANFRISLPPPGTGLTHAVVATAWSLMTRNQHVDEDQWWSTAVAVHA